MCIVLVTRTKKYYIILSNRDEFLARPTTRADWWPKPNDNVLSGRDLARSTHGTWLGITKQGRLTVLTNFRENSEAAANGATISRGEITKEFLLSDKPLDQWIEEVLSSGVYKDVGGFSLLCTILRKDAPKMAVISNRSTIEKGAHYVLGVENEVVGCQCEGLSNSLYHDEWPKVKLGKKLLAELTENDIENEEEFIEKGFKLLSTNSFTETPTINTLRLSIYIPKWSTPAVPHVPADHDHVLPEWASTDHPRWYGTREQTVILVSREDGRVVYTERTLWDEHAEPVPKDEGERRFEFTIEGWEKI